MKVEAAWHLTRFMQRSVDAQRALAHAAELKKIADDARQKREQKEKADLQENLRLAAIARDPEALKLLDFTGVTGGSKQWFAAAAAESYASAPQFESYAVATLRDILRPRFGQGDVAGDEFRRRNKYAQQQFNMSLHRLFQTVVLSRANQQRFGSDQELADTIKALRDKGEAQRATGLAELAERGEKLPKPAYD